MILKTELVQDLKNLNEAYDYLAHSFDEINTERLALKEKLANCEMETIRKVW